MHYRNFRLAAAIAVAATLAMPLMASAHEHRMYEIGGKTYAFTVGSLGEPVVVDDKTGVDLSVEEFSGKGMDHGHGSEAAQQKGTPVTGLEKTLKVEISAADKKRVMDLAPQYGKPGSYKAHFIPTVQTTLTYRFFGEINGTPVDLSFTCNPAGHPVTEDDTTEKKLSDGVTQTLKKGAFGCPMAKADLGFPEPSATINDLRSGGSERVAKLEPMVKAAKTKAGIGLLLGAASLILVLATRKKK